MQNSTCIFSRQVATSRTFLKRIAMLYRRWLVLNIQTQQINIIMIRNHVILQIKLNNLIH